MGESQDLNVLCQQIPSRKSGHKSNFGVFQHQSKMAIDSVLKAAIPALNECHLINIVSELATIDLTKFERVSVMWARDHLHDRIRAAVLDHVGRVHSLLKAKLKTASLLKYTQSRIDQVVNGTCVQIDAEFVSFQDKIDAFYGNDEMAGSIIFSNV